MPHEVPSDTGDDDDHSAHGGRAGLVVVRREQVRVNLLAKGSSREGANPKRGDEQGEEKADATGLHQTQHEVLRNNSSATTRSSKESTVSPKVCVVSWPLPATTTTSPRDASESASSMA